MDCEQINMLYEINEKDWKLFRNKVADWQESFMERLCDEYRGILDKDENASDRFWELSERIKKDRNYAGVQCELSRSTMRATIIQLLQEGAITLDDLEDFSPELRESVSLVIK